MVKLETVRQHFSLLFIVAAFALLLNIVSPLQVFASNEPVVFDKKVAVHPTKEWTVTFNEEVDVNSLKNNAIYVTNTEGEKQSVTIQRATATTVTVSAPSEGYENGETYTLTITNTVTSSSTKTALSQPVTMDFTVAAVVYDKAGTYDGETIQGDVLVTAHNVNLQNMHVTGNVVIADSVGDGDVSLTNVTVTGDIVANGGGENTILFNTVDVQGALIVNKLDGKIRILATGDSTVKTTILQSGAIVVDRTTKGGAFEQVIIPAETAAAQAIVIEGNVETLTIEAQKSDVTVNGSVQQLISDSDTDIKGDVTVGAVKPATIWKAIEAAYLGENSAATSVTKPLNLMTSIDGFEGNITWTANNEAVNVQTGNITRTQNDMTVNITATVGNEKKTFTITILAEGVNNVEQIGTDDRFVAGYPKASVKDGKIHIDVMTNVDAKVYMIVNAINGRLESSVEGVLNGYGGSKDQVMYINSWPYVETKANELVSFNTNVDISSSSSEQRIDFVLRNLDDSKQGELVTIEIDKAVIQSLDTQPPKVVMTRLNAAKDTVYMYFNEAIAIDGLQTSDFTVTNGAIRKIVKHHNYEYRSVVGSYVELRVSGVNSGDTISYNGSAITDTSIYKNKANSLSTKVETAKITIEDVNIGNDGKHVMVEISNGPHYLETAWLNEKHFKLKTAADEYEPRMLGSSHSYNGASYKLLFDEGLAITDDAVLLFTVDQESFVDYAYDTYDLKLEKGITNNILGIADKTPLTSTYNKNNGVFKLTFNNNLLFYRATFASNFVVNIDGVEYRLRGQLVSAWDSNVMHINLLADENDHYSKKIKALLEKATSVKIKYELIYGTNTSQVTDKGGALLPAFDYETVSFE